MKAEFWIKVAAKQVGLHAKRWEMAGVPKLSAKKPSAGSNEIPVKMSIEIPDTLFEEPQLNVEVKIPATKHEPIITAAMKRDIADTLATRLGIQVHITAERELVKKPKPKNFTDHMEEL